ncbi:hypothetical protein [Streptomyces sp. NBC_00019]|uniref:hypothetical protein n=1 Tax=Streptomyces sp. NBC_00019 TaxID=2975623 RepID=UPI0038659C2E
MGADRCRADCGTQPYRLDGYPKLQLLDEEHEYVDGVRTLLGRNRSAPPWVGTAARRL